MNKNNAYFLLDNENNILKESKTGAYMYQDFLKDKKFEMGGYLPVIRGDEKVTVTVSLNTENATEDIECTLVGTLIVDSVEYKIVCSTEQEF